MRNGKPEIESERMYLAAAGWGPDANGVWRPAASPTGSTLAGKVYLRLNGPRHQTEARDEEPPTPPPASFDDAYAASVYARWNRLAQAPAGRAENA